MNETKKTEIQLAVNCPNDQAHRPVGEEMPSLIETKELSDSHCQRQENDGFGAATCSSLKGSYRERVVGIMLIISMIGYIVLSVDYLLPSNYKIFPLWGRNQEKEESYEKKIVLPPESSGKMLNLNQDFPSQ